MLTNCPECGLQVSNKAILCPHCGYPLQPDAVKRPRTSKKRRRLPNGFGQISEIKDHFLRKPYRALVTTGKTETGHPICKPLKPDCYFATYNEAYEALVSYNKNPYDLESTITVQELYERWRVDYAKTGKESALTMAKTSWSYLEPIKKMRFCDLRIRHMKQCLEQDPVKFRGRAHVLTPVVKDRIKILFNKLFDYAMVGHEIYDLTERVYTERGIDWLREEIEKI